MTYLVQPLDFVDQASPPAMNTFDAFTAINLALVASADYLIFADANDSGKFKSRSKSGTVTAGEVTNIGLVIQDAIDALGARTTNATIHIDSSVDGEVIDRTKDRGQVAGIHLPSFITLIIDGKLTYAAAGTTDLIINDNRDGGGSRDESILICGSGILDGGVSTLGSASKMPVSIKHMDGFTFRDASARNSGTHNLSIDDCTVIRVLDANFLNSGDDNISCLNSTDVWIKDNHCDTTRSDFAGVTSSNIECEVELDATSDYIVSGNICINSDSEGVHCIIDSGDANPLRRVIISNNIVRDCGGIGMDITSNEQSNPAKLGNMSGNIVENAGSNAYKLSNVHGGNFIGNIAENAGGYGLTVGTGSRRLNIVGFISNNSTLEGILCSGVSTPSDDQKISNITIIAPQLYNCGTFASKVHYIRMQDVDGFTISNPVMIDDRGIGATGMDSPVRINNGRGHLVITGLSADGATSGGVTGITESSSDTVIGNNGTVIDTTNVATAAV